ncbi:MAG TPA: ferritin-like domain-containing protein [Acidimicrobiales bacterium]
MRKRRHQIEASESELRSMTRDLDDLHQDVGRPAMHEALAGWSDALRTGTTRSTNRRTFLLGAGGALAGVGVLAAVATTPGLAAAASTSSVTPTTSSTSNPEAGLSGTLAVAALAASLENLAIYTYGVAATAAQAGKLGTVPPAILQFVKTVVTQHTQHAAAWNSLLTGAGKKAVTVTDPALTPTVDQQLGQVTTLTQVAQLALMLENTAAQTYQAEASKLKSAKAVAVAATIQPVEMQHAAILYYVLGEYPGIQDSSGNPLAFNPTTLAA